MRQRSAAPASERRRAFDVEQAAALTGAGTVTYSVRTAGAVAAGAAAVVAAAVAGDAAVVAAASAADAGPVVPHEPTTSTRPATTATASTATRISGPRERMNLLLRPNRII